MPRYEAEKVFSKRFWEIERSGAEITVSRGKIGKAGKVETRTHASASEAERALEEAVAKMLKKGYRQVAEKPKVVEVPAQVAPFAPENPELEAALLIDRDDETAWRVLGDWFETQGDPRGKAIALSFANDKAAFDEHIATYAKSWLGGLYQSYALGLRAADPSDAATTIEWTHGVMHHARLAHTYDRHDDCLNDLKTLLALPAARFLYSLTLGIFDEPNEDQYAGAKEALRENPPPMLRHLYLGDFTSEECEVSWSVARGLHEYLAIFPELHSFRVLGGELTTKALRHGELRSLIIESGGCGPEVTRAVGSAQLPKLEKLELWTGQGAYGGYGPLTDYEPLLSAKTCPNLTHLGFRNSEQADPFVAMLAESALLPQLKTLDLSLGMFSPHGARTLIANKEKFAHLERIDVTESCLGDDVVADLQAHFGDVVDASKQNWGVGYDDWDEASAGALDDDARREVLFDLDCFTSVGE